jgi:hypothetical protein
MTRRMPVLLTCSSGVVKASFSVNADNGSGVWHAFSFDRSCGISTSVSVASLYRTRQATSQPERYCRDRTARRKASKLGRKEGALLEANACAFDCVGLSGALFASALRVERAVERGLQQVLREKL